MSQQQFDNRLSGALFTNDNRTKDSQPNYRGSITLEDDKEYWVSAWIKTARNGNRFLSLALTAKDEPQNNARASRSQDQDDFLDQNASRIAQHRDNGKGDMQGGPSRAPAPRPAADFDSFDDDIPF